MPTHTPALVLSATFVLFGCAAAETDDARGTCTGDVCPDGGTDDDAGDRDARPAFDATSDGALTDSAIGTDAKTDGGGTDAKLDSAITEAGDAVSSDTASGDTGLVDGGVIDSGKIDSGAIDSGKVDTGFDAGPTGPITGGPCISGSAGATAFRIKWVNGGGTATVSYEVDGLPDKSRWKAGAYGYSIGFSPSFVDPFLGEGGLQLDSSDFVDIELSTVGLSTIRSAKLAIYGRSFNTTASGSFDWMTFTDSGSTPIDFVSNVAPYRWYAYDATSAFRAGDGGVLLRIKAGPSSDALVVNRIELCMDAS